MTIPAAVRRLSGGPVVAGLLLALFAVAVFAPGLSTLPVTDRDEALFAQTSRQMVEGGGWVEPRFQDEPRYKKPIGIYWLQAGVVSIGGLDPGAIAGYRLPSLLGAVAAVVLTFVIGTILADRGTGLVAALLFAGTIGIGIEARLAKTDATLLAATLAAQAVIAWIVANPARPPGLLRLAVFWTAVAAGVLVKGPPILLVVGGTLLGLAAADRGLRVVRALRPLAGLAGAALLVAPWFVAIGLASGGDFFRESLGRDFAAKITGGRESHGGLPGLHLLMQVGLFWPAAAFVPSALVRLWPLRRRPAVVFLAAWLLPAWVVFEIVPTKLPNYVLPLMPAVAVAIALAVRDDRMTGRPADRLSLWAPVGAVILAAAAVAVPPAFGAPIDVLGGLLAVTAVAAVVVGTTGRPAGTSAGLGITAAAGAVLAAVAISRSAPAVREAWASDRIAEAVAAVPACRSAPVTVVGYAEPSIVFRLGTATRLASTDASRHPQTYAGSCAVVVDVRKREAAEPALRAARFAPDPAITAAGRNLNGFRPRRYEVWRPEGF